jgi:hypothetical protein
MKFVRKTGLLVAALLLLGNVPFGASNSMVNAATFTVTTTSDNGAGSLRQAITDANNTVGSDVIDFSAISGTITLSSALPDITSDITINGPGESTLTITGVDTYRIFYVSGGSFAINNITLTHGASSGYAAFIYNSGRVLNITNVTFKDSTGNSYAVYSAGNGAVATFTSCTFQSVFSGIGTDYGNGPSTTSDTETDYFNRAYVINSTFRNSTYGIFATRFLKINGSTFTSNSIAVSSGSLQRHYIQNSTFSNNSTAISGGMGVPTAGWNLLANNRFIDGNTFTNNRISIFLDDNWNDGHKTQIWNTVSNNTWDGGQTWIYAKKWDAVTSANVDITKTAVNTTGNEWTELNNTVPPAPTTTTIAPATTTIAPTTTTIARTTTTIAPTTTSTSSANTQTANTAATTTTTTTTIKSNIKISKNYFSIQVAKVTTKEIIKKLSGLRLTKNSKFRYSILKRSKKICSFKGTRLRGLSTGMCHVRVDSISANGKQTSRIVLVKVTK